MAKRNGLVGIFYHENNFCMLSIFYTFCQEKEVLFLNAIKTGRKNLRGNSCPNIVMYNGPRVRIWELLSNVSILGLRPKVYSIHTLDKMELNF